MIPPVRQEILRVLADLSACCPDVRFGQLLANLSYLAKGPTNEALWEMEDEELLAAAQQHLATLRQRQTPVP
jgi:hypothetical protein